MSQAEELLNGMSEEVPVHTHPVPDTDTYFVIDPVTRKIENTNPKKYVIMQYDHNSERCTFELPRFIDGHDMLECTSVTVNVDNIEVVESDGVDEAEPVEPRINSDAPDMTDLRIHPNDPEKVISSWLISRNSTQLAGILSFHIEYKCVDADGNVVYEWSTDNYDEYEIRARKKNGEAALAPHADLLEQWRTRIFGAGDSVMANIAAEGEAQVTAVKAESETQQDAVELKGAQTLDSIPEDYTKVDAMADEAVRSKGDAIVCEVAGESITIKDSSSDHIRGLKVFGKSTQNGVPTPDNPQEIVSIENPVVNIDTQSFAINRTLPGIPVTSGGNYTDSDGQQWICDEIDLERGVYVQRLYRANPDFTSAVVMAPSSGHTEGRVNTNTRFVTNGMCDRFVYSQAGSAKERFAVLEDGAIYFTIKGELTADAWRAKMTELSPEILVRLATPIETPLTAEEIAAFKALRTNYPNTTILNDAGAWMSVKYNADTKTYVENPKTLKLVDSSTGVVYELKIVNGSLTVNPV